MKTLRNTDLVFHAWAHQAYPEAKAASVSFIGSKLYSYRACIANLLPNGVVVFSNRIWTITTSSHQSSALKATNHQKRVYCWDPEASPERNREHAMDRIVETLGGTTQEFRKDGQETMLSKKRRFDKQDAAKRIALEANEYMKAVRADLKPIDIESFEQLTADTLKQKAEDKVRREKEAAERQVRLAEQQKEQVERAKAKIDDWRQYRPVFGLNMAPPALRMSKDGDCIETSWGAVIPRLCAPNLWLAIKRVMRAGTDWNPGRTSMMKLGHYTLTMIRADGSIVVGCHDIAFSEIEGIAKVLELV